MSKGKRPTHGYVARRRGCGCVLGITADDEDRPRDTAQSVAQFIREGLYIERFTWEQYQSAISKEPTFLDCPHENGQISIFEEVTNV